jgi:hypothetical protein
MQQLYHPWSSYVIVPLFALANVGISIGGGFLARAFGSPITLGILCVASPGGERYRRETSKPVPARGTPSLRNIETFLS